MFRVCLHIVWVVFLTLLTQLGGFAWLIALGFRRRAAAFVLIYATFSVAAVFVAPHFGRVALPCFGDGTTRMHSVMYCALNRQFVVPELAEVVNDLGDQIERAHPGTQTLILDGNFPFINGFPLLPHLSHSDGRKVDVAFYYERDGAFANGQTPSPIGYFAFEDGPTQCPPRLLTLRWNMGWLQGLWPDYDIDRDRMVTSLRWLNAEPRVGKVLIEPHLLGRFGVSGQKLRFQGCRAARHDDHIHIQL